MSLLSVKRGLPSLVYFCGLIPLAIFQSEVRTEFGDSLAFGAVVAYLIALRALAWVGIRMVEWRERLGIERHNAAVTTERTARMQSRKNSANET